MNDLNLTINEIEQLNTAVEKLLAKKGGGSKTWREIMNLAMKYNPKIRREVFLVTEANKELRESSNKYASNQSGSMRNALSMPTSVHNLLDAYDDGFTLQTEAGIKKAWKVFPEFRKAEVI